MSYQNLTIAECRTILATRKALAFRYGALARVDQARAVLERSAALPAVFDETAALLQLWDETSHATDLLASCPDKTSLLLDSEAGYLRRDTLCGMPCVTL
jgi:hypothetical protein